MSPQDNANLPATLNQQANVEAYRQSTNAAHLCGEIVKSTAMSIQGKKYVRVEGWQAIAIAHGCAASSRDVEAIEGGLRAIGEVRRMSDGFVIASAEGFLGDDEQMWQKRPMFARRAMVQTRAISRACRSAFAHVVIMIDKSLSTTPAEEMQGLRNGGGDDWEDITREAKESGLSMPSGDKSQYEVDKRKKAVAAGWKVTNTTPKGKQDQVFDYLDMAHGAIDVNTILEANKEEIALMPKRAAVAEAADDLLKWFEKNTSAALQ